MLNIVLRAYPRCGKEALPFLYMDRYLSAEGYVVVQLFFREQGFL